MAIPFSTPAAFNPMANQDAMMQGFSQTGSALNSRYENDRQFKRASEEKDKDFAREQKIHPDIQFGIQGLISKMRNGEMTPQEAAAHGKLLMGGQHPSPHDHLPPGSPLLASSPPGGGYSPPDFTGGNGPMPDQSNYVQLPGSTPSQDQGAPQMASAAAPSGAPPGYTANDLRALQGLASASYMSERPDLYREKNQVTRDIGAGKLVTEDKKETGRNVRAEDRTVEKKAEFGKMMDYRWASLAASRERTSKLLSLAQQRNAAPEVAALRAILGEQDTLLRQKTSITNSIQRLGGLASAESQRALQDVDSRIQANESQVQQVRTRLMNFSGAAQTAPGVTVRESQSSSTRGDTVKVRSKKTGTTVALPADQAGRFLGNPNYEQVP